MARRAADHFISPQSVSGKSLLRRIVAAETAARLERGISKEDLARECHLGRTAIHYFEKGQWGRTTIAKLEEILGAVGLELVVRKKDSGGDGR